jgi:hypothetical protein
LVIPQSPEVACTRDSVESPQRGTSEDLEQEPVRCQKKDKKRTTFNATTAVPTEEYFVKDHLGNVRSVINVSGYELHTYLATYELASAHLEDLVFDNMDDIRDIRPGGNDDNTMAANLNGGDDSRVIGTSLLVHVMAGDKVAMNVSSYFNGYDPNQDVPLQAPQVMSQIVSTLMGGDGGFGGSESHNTRVVQQVFNPDNYQVLDELTQAVTDPSKPKAYLNYALFDENMNLVKEMSGAFQASGDGDWAEIGTTSALEVPTNGYLAVYLSNTSVNLSCTPCSDVYFCSRRVSCKALCERRAIRPYIKRVGDLKF